MHVQGSDMKCNVFSMQCFCSAHAQMTLLESNIAKTLHGKNITLHITSAWFSNYICNSLLLVVTGFSRDMNIGNIIQRISTLQLMEDD